MIRSQLLSFAVALGTLASASAGEIALEAKQTVSPVPVADDWEFKLSMPAWIPWMSGDMGLNGRVAHVDLGPSEIIPNWDMVADIRAEAQKGRFSILGELLYNSSSDGVGTNTVVKKLDFQVDQTMADVGLGWRILEGPRGSLDLLGGVRYTNLYQKVALQANDSRIDELASRLARAGTAVRVVLARELRALRGDDPEVPIAPLDGDQASQLARRVERVKGNTAERQDKIARLLKSSLNRTVSRTDDWWDPYIGLRGRLILTDVFYLTAKGDIGGFGVGSDLSWTAEAAIGTQITRQMFAEVGYRALGVNYDKDGLLVDTVTHGIQLTLGLTF